MTQKKSDLAAEAFRIKDDWPQALVMSMGTLFLLAGLGLEIARFVAVQDAPKTGGGSAGGFLSLHPGLILLALGVIFTLLGYFLPRTRAK